MTGILGVGAPIQIWEFTIVKLEDDNLTQQSHVIAGYNKFAILTPASMTSTSIGFQAAYQKPPGSSLSTFVTVVDDTGSAVAVTCSPSSQWISITSQAPSLALAGAYAVKLTTGSGEAADRTIYLIGSL